MRAISYWQPECLVGKLLSFYARKVPEHPAKIRIFRWLSSLKPQLIFSINKKARFTVVLKDYIGHAICFKGVWEPKSLAASVQIMKGHESKTFLDIGANHGIFTVTVGAIVGCPCLAIEPMKKNLDHLIKNIQLNGGLKVKVIPFAATAKRKEVSLTSEHAGREAWTKIDNNIHEKTGEIVHGRPLQEVLEGGDCEGVRLMKIDVEGYELEVFQGLVWESALAPEVIIMECHPSEVDKIFFLTNRGYRAKTVDGKEISGLSEYPEGNLIFTREVLKT